MQKIQWRSSMVKAPIPFFLFVLLNMLGCKSTINMSEYMGQNYPGSTPEIFASGIVSIKDRLEHGISFSPDTKELLLGLLDKDDFSGRVLYSKMVNGHWTKPMPFEPLRNVSAYLPYFSPDGKRVLYAQSKTGTDLSVTDIWMLTKVKGEWTLPHKVTTPVSSDSREANATMTNDGTLYFSSNRNCEGNENCYKADLYYSKRSNNEYSVIEEVSSLNSEYDHESVFISPQEDYIIFCRYTNDQTQMDLYISYRDVNKNWLTPTLLDSTINSKYWDRRPFVSIDNQFLFYTQLQIGSDGLTESDIYWVNTSKVFKPYVYNPMADISVRAGEKFKIVIPSDYFKDIDDMLLDINIDQKEFDWLDFDQEHMVLSGLPAKAGEYELTFTAVDTDANRTEDLIKLKVFE